MCGIVGTIGTEPCVERLFDGLRRLEYRGYDSAGLAVHDGSRITVVRAQGRLDNLGRALQQVPLVGSLGIGHTRWATHGRPSRENAHPHQVGPVALVHNGIIENHLELRAELEHEGAVFQSETDSEILCHLIARAVLSGQRLGDALRAALARVEGSYAVAVLSETEPEELWAARRFSPLVIGLGEEATFVASDVLAFLPYARDVIYLDDGEMACVTRGGVRLFGADGTALVREPQRLDASPSLAEKGGYKHFMLKEIMEQPRAVVDSLRGRVSLTRGQVEFDGSTLEQILALDVRRVVLVACGTSWHAALVGKRWFEGFAGLPAEVEVASEYRSGHLLDRHTLFVALSQSGETADTLAAMRVAREGGALTLAVTNVVGSSLARLADLALLTHAGPEISVASTKAFTTQLVMLYLLSVGLAQARENGRETETRRLLERLVHVPQLMEATLKRREAVKQAARRLYPYEHFLFLGRHLNVPIALEGALKLKEISYIHAEGYPAGEMKHGPIALIDEHVVVVALAPLDRWHDKMLSNMAEARARGGYVLAVGTEGDATLTEAANEVLWLPATDEALLPFLTILPLQLLAYDIADFKGTDVDQPRNLAKSVTVE